MDQIPCDSVEASGAVFQQELTHMLADCTRAELRVITETVRARKDSLRQMPPGG